MPIPNAMQSHTPLADPLEFTDLDQDPDVFRVFDNDLDFTDLYDPQHGDAFPGQLHVGSSPLKVLGLEYLEGFLNARGTAKAIVPGLFIQVNAKDYGFLGARGLPTLCCILLTPVSLGFTSTGTKLAECLQEPVGDDSCGVDARYKAGDVAFQCSILYAWYRLTGRS
jgi:hypothetical protein